MLRANPKSHNLAVPSSSNRIFCGLRSLKQINHRAFVKETDRFFEKINVLFCTYPRISLPEKKLCCKSAKTMMKQYSSMTNHYIDYLKF